MKYIYIFIIFLMFTTQGCYFTAIQTKEAREMGNNLTGEWTIKSITISGDTIYNGSSSTPQLTYTNLNIGTVKIMRNSDFGETEKYNRNFYFIFSPYTGLRVPSVKKPIDYDYTYTYASIEYEATLHYTAESNILPYFPIIYPKLTGGTSDFKLLDKKNMEVRFADNQNKQTGIMILEKKQ